MESLPPECSAFGVVRGPAGSAPPGIAPSNAYRCMDEHMVLITAASGGPSKTDAAPVGSGEEGTAPNAGAYVLIAGNSDSICKRLMETIGRVVQRMRPANTH